MTKYPLYLILPLFLVALNGGSVKEKVQVKIQIRLEERGKETFEIISNKGEKFSIFSAKRKEYPSRVEIEFETKPRIWSKSEIEIQNNVKMFKNAYISFILDDAIRILILECGNSPPFKIIQYLDMGKNNILFRWRKNLPEEIMIHRAYFVNILKNLSLEQSWGMGESLEKDETKINVLPMKNYYYLRLGPYSRKKEAIAVKQKALSRSPEIQCVIKEVEILGGQEFDLSSKGP